MLTLLLETIKGWVLNHFVRKGNGEDTKAIIGRYNVLDYGLIPNIATKGNVNTSALRQMIADVPEGSVIYFPQGLYYLNDSIEINKSLSLVGDTHIKVDTLPTASADYLNTQYLYTGNQTGLYKGGIYECQETSSNVYEWVLLSVSIESLKDLMASATDFADLKAKVATL